MINPTRYTLGAIDNTGSVGMYEDPTNGEYVTYSSFVELVAHSIEGASNKEFLEKQVPALKQALMQILRLAAAEGDDELLEEIADIAGEALTK